MAQQRLPTPGQDDGTWGDILNGYLGVAHDANGNLLTSAVTTALPSPIPTAKLGSGAASSSNYLRGDGTWAVPAGLVVSPGIIADGTTDMTATIQALLDANQAVILPPGQIAIAGTLSMPNGASMRGLTGVCGDFGVTVNNNVVSTLLKTANGNCIQVPVGSSRVTLKGFRIDGANNVRTSGDGIHLVDSGASEETQLVIEDVYVAEAKGCGLYVGANRRGVSLLRTILYNDAQSTGPACSVNGADFTATNSMFTAWQNNTVNSLYLNASSSKIISCDIWSGQFSVFIETGSGHSLIGNNIDQAWKNGIWITGPPTGVNISGGRMESNSQAGDGFYAHIHTECTSPHSIVGVAFSTNEVGNGNKVTYGVDTGGSGIAPMVAANTIVPGTYTNSLYTFSESYVLSSATIARSKLDSTVAGLPATASVFVSRWSSEVFSTFYATLVANSAYVVEVNVLLACTITGIMWFNGDTIGSNCIVSLFDSTGTRVALSSSTAQSGTYIKQAAAFTTPYVATPGAYYLALTPNNTTGKFTVGTAFEPNASVAVGSFAAPSSITPLSATASFGNIPALSTY